MKLWTWQNPILNITNPNMRIESIKYSQYKFPEKYKKLWSILGTDQFHWYFTDEEDATDNDCLDEYKGKVLWELELPEDKIFKKICCMSWHWIIIKRDVKPPKIFENSLNKFLWPDRTTFSKDCNKYWRDMKPEQLWDCLFYDCGVKQCYQVLLRHPVDVSWVIKNPLKDINWWQKH